MQNYLYSSKQLVVQSMDEITFKIRQGQEDLTVVQYASPLSVAQALLEENASWIGALQEEGSSKRVGSDQQLKPGSSYILTLQRQAGTAVDFCAYLLLRLHKAEQSGCSLSVSPVA